MTLRVYFINRQQPPPWLLYFCLLCSSGIDCSILKKFKILKWKQHERWWLWGFLCFFSSPHWFSCCFMKCVSSTGWNLCLPFHPRMQGWALPARSTFLTLICSFIIPCPIQGKGCDAFWEAHTRALGLPCRNLDILNLLPHIPQHCWGRETWSWIEIYPSL